MINIFALSNGRLVQGEVDSREGLPRPQAIWVDLEEPTPEEKRWVKQHFGLAVPEDAIDEDIEESARFYAEDDGELHIRSDFLVADPDEPHQIRVAFILSQASEGGRNRDILFSIHEESVPALRLVRMRARRMPGSLENAKDVLLALLDGDTEYCADALEGVYDALEELEKSVLDGGVTDEVASEVLGTIARQEDMNGRIRRNMMDTRRAVSFLMRSKLLEAEQFDVARQLLRDIDSLDSHTTFLSDKINFLMDATVGFLNVNQNKIIKIFSVASVALLPPTLIASIYGMNFRAMPELEWQYGYLLAIVAMLASALLPMWYFRRRGWLK